MGRSKLNINRNKMKILILAAFIALTSIAICESASGFSYFFTPRRGPIAKSSSITPAHHGYKHVVHPYRSHYRAHPKKTHIYVAPKMTPTYSHPKKTYGFKLIGEVHSGEAKPRYKPTETKAPEVDIASTEKDEYDYRVENLSSSEERSSEEEEYDYLGARTDAIGN